MDFNQIKQKRKVGKGKQIIAVKQAITQAVQVSLSAKNIAHVALRLLASRDQLSIKDSQETGGLETARGREDEIEMTKIEKGSQRGEEKVIRGKQRYEKEAGLKGNTPSVQRWANKGEPGERFGWPPHTRRHCVSVVAG